ncbi:MAG: type I-E CRISPR-associated protein Cse2/CasB [Desulfovibrio sp.]|nr:type I-E CRISPR-associated protein Cse2/CasB [Desulfovibrio sp.]
MSKHDEKFIAHLKSLKERDRGALATLRHSLAFAPGTYPQAFPYVERFAGVDSHERDARRLALYAVAGLFARHPAQASASFATAFGELMRRRGSASIEKRFLALLGADAENVFEYLKQAISLLAADGPGCNYAQLLNDLSSWLNPNLHEQRDRLRQRWARDFYRALRSVSETENTLTE